MATPSPFIQRALVALALYTVSAWALILVGFVAWSPGRSVARTAMAALVNETSHATSPASTGYAFAVAATPYMARFQVHDAVVCDTPEAIDGTLVGVTSDGDPDGFSWRIHTKDGQSWSDAWNLKGDEPEGEAWFWFRDGGVSYVVRDPALVAEAQATVQPLEEIGAEMGKVGSQMGRNAAVAGRLAGRMGGIAARIGALEARAAVRQANALQSARRGEASAELEALRAELETMQRQVEDEQRVHERDNDALNQRMSELSARHAARLDEVRHKLREIAARARREGRAERPHAKA